MWSPISRSSFIRYTAVSGVCWTPTQSPIKGIKYVPLQRRPEHSFLQNLWSQSLHETKYSPENDAKSPFAVPHTLSGRAVLRLWQCSSLCYSTAQASVQEPRLCWCVMGCHYSQAGIICLWGLPHNICLICLIPKLESVIWFEYLNTWKRL